MEVSVVLAWIVILSQFGCVWCYEYQKLDCYHKNLKRIKRNHENDNSKQKAAETKPNKTTIPTGSKSAPQRTKTVPKPGNKEKLPTNEANETNNIRTVNNILEEIAAIARNQKETKNIPKIKNLVDELDKYNKVKACVESKNPKKEKIAYNNEIVTKVTNKVSQNCKLVPKTVDVKGNIKIKDDQNKCSVESNANKLLLPNGKASSIKTCTQVDETTTDENVIEVEEHKYEEELLRSPYKYTQNNEQIWYTGQNCNTGYNIGQYANYQNGNTIGNYDETSNNYPLANYGKFHNRNNGYFYTKLPSELNEPYCYNNDYAGYRNSWMERDTLINAKNPNDIKETTNIQNYDINSHDNNIAYRDATNYNNVLFSNYGDTGLNYVIPSDQPYYQTGNSYTKLRKSWLDRDIMINEKSHDERLLDENRKEVTSIQSPDYFKKYYAVTEKHVLSNDDMMNDYSYRYP